MKTKEFIEKVKALGYNIVKHELEIQVWGDEYDVYSKARIFKTEMNSLTLNSNSYKLTKLCIEYAETPIAEREEVKKYKVALPNPEVMNGVFALARTNDKRIVINQTSASNFEHYERFHLTESEIKRNHSYLWQFAKEVKK